MREMLELIDRELLRSGYKNYLAGGVIVSEEHRWSKD